MPQRNLQFLLIVALISLCCVWRTSFREQILLSAMRRIERASYYAPSEETLLQGGIAGFFLPLQEDFGDRYSAYIPPQSQHEHEMVLENRLEGIGVLLQENRVAQGDSVGGVRVLFPFFWGPAARAGILAGDDILRVDETSLEGMSLGKITSIMRGKPGTRVSLLVQTENNPPREIIVERESLQRPTVEGDTILASGDFSFTLENHPQIGYIRISCFTDETPAEVARALALCADVEYLILDLRGNPGGSLPASVAVANFFVEPNATYNDIVQIRYRDAIRNRFPAEKGSVFTKPMVVLIDGESASAAEIVAAALQDFERAILVGTRTFGKGTVQEISPLPMQSGLLCLTVAHYLRPSGKNIQRIISRGQNSQHSEKPWGVSPHELGEVLLTPHLTRIAAQVRQLRGNVPNAESCVQRFREQLARNEIINEEIVNEIIVDETKNESEPLPGTAPYYDPQLDRAIELLLLHSITEKMT